MSKLRKLVPSGIFIAGVLITASSLSASTAPNTPPPNDDSEKSTVRVNTAWTEHELNLEDCLKKANKTLELLGYYVTTSSVSSYGLKEGLTTTIRCDAPNIAFILSAHRKRPPLDEQAKIINEIINKFDGTKSSNKKIIIH